MTSVALAIVIAVASAASFGLSGALQHRVDRSAATHGGGPVELVLQVVRRPVWLLSLLAAGAAVAGQGLALALAPLVLVQPLLVTGVLFAAVFSALLSHSKPDRLVTVGALLCAAGLSAFLILARPGEGISGLPSLSRVWPLATVFAAALVGCGVLALRPPTPQTRTLALALATGIFYGMNAGVAKLAIDQYGTGGLHALVTSWPLWSLAVLGPPGFVLNQLAFGTGVAVSPALAVITVTDPLMSLGLGVVWLGETLRATPALVGGEVAALGVVTAGVVLLTRRAPEVAEAMEEHSPAAGSASA